jgi:deazaflavin-dependent oxidoreductase (nitroreductase family)
MGLAAELGYAYPKPNRLQAMVQAFAGTRLGAQLTPRTLVPLDRLTTRVAKGRVSLPAVLAGLPVLDLVTVGRKTGLPRGARVIAVPFHDTLGLLGTNFGQPNTPAWVLNLESHSGGTMTYAGTTREVVARAATDDERAAILLAAAGVFGGASKYEQRLEGRRRVRIFVLEHAASEP